MKIPQAIETVTACCDLNIPTHLWGAPGIGKSDLMREVADRRGADLCDIRLSLFDPVDLRGLPSISDGMTQWLRPQIWPTRTDRETVLFFDEMDRASPAVMSAAMQIVLDRRIGEHVLPATVRIVAAGNGKTDRVGTNKMPAALANRFCHIDLEPDAEAWRDWAAGAAIDPFLIAFMHMRPEHLHHAESRDGRTFPSPRAWERVNRAMGQPEAVRHAIAKGLVGEGPAGEFEAFIRAARNLPSIPAILANPTGERVPSEPAERFAVAGALARAANPQNFDSVLAYVARLPREFEIMAATDATRRNRALTATPAYVAWSVRNQDVTL